MTRTRLRFAPAIYLAVSGVFGAYFAFAAVQGDSGMFRRIQIESETARLQTERDQLAGQLAELELRTRRLSDTHLDLDLLDEQARDVLGYLRPDEVILR
jgi:cell division protein FtsB